MLPLAHAGHWVLWFLYLPPLLIVIFSITKNKLSERRERRAKGSR
jgi:ABC-type spermidine/putrescine transport system permease subunit II